MAGILLFMWKETKKETWERDCMKDTHGILAFFCALLVLLCLAGCGKEEKNAAKPPLVKTLTAEPGTLISQTTYAGTVRGRYESNLSFQVGGRILSRNVQAGSYVHAGDVLMTLDPRDVIRQAEQGDAQAASALAQMELARANLDRYRQLYEAGAASASTLDQYQTNYNVAAAAYENAKAQAAQGHNALSYASLTANADGVISSVSVEEGQVIAAGQTALSLVQTEELEVEIQVPEQRLQDAVIGNSATIRFWAMPGTVTGRIREVSPMADAASRTYTVRLSLPQPPPGLQLGMTADASLAPMELAEARMLFLLPLSAVYQTDHRPQVWVVDGQNRVQLKDISVEEFGDNQVAVTGLSDGDRVVIAGVHNLREGQEVRLKGDGS